MEMQESDQPPEAIWLDDDALEEHFEALKEKYRSGNNGTESVPEYEQNELTKGLR